MSLRTRIFVLGRGRINHIILHPVVDHINREYIVMIDKQGKGSVLHGRLTIVKSYP